MTYRFFTSIIGIVLLYLFAYGQPQIINAVHTILGAVFLIAMIEGLFLKHVSKYIKLSRKVSDRLSLGENHDVKYSISNSSKWGLSVEVVDELPVQLQHRSSIGKIATEKDSVIDTSFEIRPLVRGNFHFGILNAFISLKLPGLVEYRKSFDAEFTTKIFPSILQMRKYELQVFSKTATFSGIRKIRQLGENDEFESIRPYVVGDNIKSINWKATSKSNSLMVNQFQNTRSQQVYCLIDQGRSMEMPFDGLSLLDHSVNSALVLSNIILKKYDKAGIIPFSNRIDAILKSENKLNQIEYIADKLYNLETQFLESNFELLYFTVRKKINKRSILLLYTNFESLADLDRNINYLKQLNKLHLLVVIIFENTEVKTALSKVPLNKKDIYFKTMATAAIIEKEQMIMKLNALGIMSILTSPKDLNIEVINKYLEIKSKHKI